MTRIYHTWDRWECYPAGFYNPQPPNGMTAKQAQDAYSAFLRDTKLFESCLERVTTEWIQSCEHYLSNEKMNRIAWLGQASVCIHSGIPHGFRGGFNHLTDGQQDKANQAALKWLNIWLEARGEPVVSMEEAGVTATVNVY